MGEEIHKMIEAFKKINCDLCGKAIEYRERPRYQGEPEWVDRESGETLPVWKSLTLPVVFLTEQNEGRSSKPYFDNAKIDVCPECYKRLLEEYPITGYGAQGYNTYKWR